MQATEKAGLIKLFQIASLIALKGRSFSDYSSLLDFEKIHGVKFLEKYEHGNSWRELINNTSDYLFNKDAKKKVLRTNFTGVLNDGTTDAAIEEQEVTYVTFLDPDNFEPRLTCLTAAELNESLDAQGLKRALLNLLKIITSRAYWTKSFSSHRTEHQ